MRAARRSRAPLVRAFAPDVVVADILTLAPALAAELEGVPCATLIPHVDPRGAAGLAALLDRRAAAAHAARARRCGARSTRSSRAGSSRAASSSTRRARAARPAAAATTSTAGSRASWRSSRRSRSSSTRARWPSPATHVVGPLLWEPPSGDVELPPGDAPLVLVAPSTSQDPEQRLLRAALDGPRRRAGARAGHRNRRPPPTPLAVPPNARLVEWVSYARTMPRCDVVVCHGGHGTVVRALAAGCVVVVVPAAGDMNENAARVDWAGRRRAAAAALRDARARCGSRCAARWRDPRCARGRASSRHGRAAHDGAARAAELVERFAQRTRASRAPALAVPTLPDASRTTA